MFDEYVLIVMRRVVSYTILTLYLRLYIFSTLLYSLSNYGCSSVRKMSSWRQNYLKILFLSTQSIATSTCDMMFMSRNIKHW